jgi:hypothetical protein
MHFSPVVAFFSENCTTGLLSIAQQLSSKYVSLPAPPSEAVNAWISSPFDVLTIEALFAGSARSFGLLRDGGPERGADVAGASS